MHSTPGSAPLAFGPMDSNPRGRVVWRGIGNSSIVTGGVQVTGWQLEPGKSAVFSASVPAAAARLTAVRQLWVHGVRANRTSIAGDAFNQISPAPSQE